MVVRFWSWAAESFTVVSPFLWLNDSWAILIDELLLHFMIVIVQVHISPDTDTSYAVQYSPIHRQAMFNWDSTWLIWLQISNRFHYLTQLESLIEFCSNRRNLLLLRPSFCIQTETTAATTTTTMKTTPIFGWQFSILGHYGEWNSCLSSVLWHRQRDHIIMDSMNAITFAAQSCIKCIWSTQAWYSNTQKSSGKKQPNWKKPQRSLSLFLSLTIFHIILNRPNGIQFAPIHIFSIQNAYFIALNISDNIESLYAEHEHDFARWNNDLHSNCWQQCFVSVVYLIVVACFLFLFSFNLLLYLYGSNRCSVQYSVRESITWKIRIFGYVKVWTNETKFSKLSYELDE